MERSRTTVVAAVGPLAGVARSVLEAAAATARLVVSLPAPEDPSLERAVAARRAAAGVSSPYLVHDADPLSAVAAAWTVLYDETGPIGTLEVAVSEAVAAWRGGRVELPDYYLVLDPERWAPTPLHFYLGWLATQAPARVLPAPASPPGVSRVLRNLPSGRWWPPLDRLLDGVARVVPDALVISRQGQAPEAGLITGPTASAT